MYCRDSIRTSTPESRVISRRLHGDGARPRRFFSSQRDEASRLQSRFDDNRRTLIDYREQLDHVLVTHPHAPVTGSCADFVLVFGAMNVDIAVARIRIVLVQSVEPQNTRHDRVLRRRSRFVRPKRNPPDENSSVGHIASNLLRDAETAGWRFEAPLLCPDAEPRCRHGVRANGPFVFFYGELLVSN